MDSLKIETFSVDYVFTQDFLYRIALIPYGLGRALTLWPIVLFALALLLGSGPLLVTWLLVVFINLYLVRWYLRRKRISTYSLPIAKYSESDSVEMIPALSIISATLRGANLTIAIKGEKYKLRIKPTDVESDSNFLRQIMQERLRVE
jgi:hypothetical protein